MKLTLPGNRQLLVNACWLRYAYNPEYSCNYPNIGHNTSVWVAEDALRGLADMQHIMEKDTKPYLTDDDTPIIIGGDFNSCSHLDWTQAAAPIHFGYGPVPFPISQYMLDEGFKDSLSLIHISYQVPKQICQKIRMQGMSVAFVGQNLLIWTKDFRFSDPDRASDKLNSPSCRYVGFNVKLDF